MKKTLARILTVCASAVIVFLVFHYRDVMRVASRPKIKWTHQGRKGFYDRISIGPENTIYVLTVEGWTQHYLLEALDPNGTVKWTREEFLTAPAIDSQGRLFVYGFEPGARDRRFLKALDAEGHDVWTWPMPENEPYDLTAPAIGSKGNLFVGGRYVRAFDRDGRPLWIFGQVSDNVVYEYGRPLIGLDGNLYVLRKRRIDSPEESGHVLVLNQAGEQLGDADVFNRNATLLPIDSQRVAAVGMDMPIGTNTNTAGLAIKADASSVKMDSTLARVRMIGEKKWYLVSQNRDLTVIDPSGRKLCSNTGDDYFEHWILANDGTVYAGGAQLISISPSCWNGWRINLRSPVFSLLLGSDGTIYVLTQDGVLHALTETFASGGPARSLWPGDGHDSRNTNSALETP